MTLMRFFLQATCNGVNPFCSRHNDNHSAAVPVNINRMLLSCYYIITFICNNVQKYRRKRKSSIGSEKYYVITIYQVDLPTQTQRNCCTNTSYIDRYSKERQRSVLYQCPGIDFTLQIQQQFSHLYIATVSSDMQRSQIVLTHHAHSPVQYDTLQ